MKSMKPTLKRLLDRAPYIRGLREELEKQGSCPAGHYHSPVPSAEDVRAHLDRRKPADGELAGIRMNEREQRELIEEFAGFYNELPFPEERGSSRYYYENPWFSYSDAIFLYCFLRKFQPRRIVEVGSGFSSAVMLDTVETAFVRRPEIIFIEPYPDRLKTLLREADKEEVTIIEKNVQEVSSGVFSELGSGDLLFVDSSHVVKCGSDLHRLIFEILPDLDPGVFVHFHDVFHPFDYPEEWLIEGRYWNENYFLRAFLSYNSEWSIVFFNHYLHCACGDMIAAKMPLCARNPGGSLYIRRNPEG